MTLQIFKTQNPGCRDDSWLFAYFHDMVSNQMCCGIFDDAIVVSCTDAPSMLYLKNQIQEIGIQTLPEYRNRGHAAECCIKCVENIIKVGKCPCWSADFNNAASITRAFAVGFKKLADVFTITLSLHTIFPLFLFQLRLLPKYLRAG